MTVHGVCLAGHGSTVEALNRSTWQQWLGSVEAGLERLASDCATIHLAGFSTGGTLALMAAHRALDRVASLALMAVPLWLPLHARTSLRLLRQGGVALLLSRTPRRLHDGLLELTRLAVAPMDRAYPLRASISLEELTRLALAIAPFVHRPALLLHSRRDPVVPFACSGALLSRLPDARRVPLERSGHVITTDVERDVVAQRVGDFFLRVVA
jgi:carboxylesterase